MKLKVRNGSVKALLKSGKDFVKTEMSEAEAKHIIDTGKTVRSVRADYPMCIDKIWFFQCEEEKKEEEI